MYKPSDDGIEHVKHYARRAKAIVDNEYEKGSISKLEKHRVDRAADRKLHHVRTTKEHELDHWGN